jgi:hypothetical protein
VRQQINNAALSEAANDFLETYAVTRLVDSLRIIGNGALSVHCLKYSEFGFINAEMWPTKDNDA